MTIAASIAVDQDSQNYKLIVAGKTPKPFATWESNIAYLKGLVEQHDQLQWQIGRFAAQIPNVTKTDMVRDVASEIGLSPKTLQKYIWVASAWDEDVVSEFPTLSFSHFQAVTSLYKEEPGRALDLLREADEYGRSVAWMESMANDTTPSIAPYTIAGTPDVCEIDGATVILISVTGSVTQIKQSLMDAGIYRQPAEIKITQAV